MANKNARKNSLQQVIEQDIRFRHALKTGASKHKNNVVDHAVIGVNIQHEFSPYVIRKADTFNRSLKTQDTDKIRLAYALHMFTNYSVPKRVQAIWLLKQYHQDSQAGRLRRNVPAVLATTRFKEERFACFFLVGAGKSPYKELFKDFLSKKEVHRFLNCRFDLDYYRCMFWSIARTFTDDDGLALRIAQSKIGERDYHSEFWRDVVRFFAANPLPLSQINDLYDFIMHMLTQNSNYSLKGRTLHSMQVAMKVWHRELALVKKIGNVSWEGLAVPDWTHRINDREEWKVTQLLNGKQLAREGSAMHHCVSTYKYSCASGRIGIFSLTVRHGLGEFERAITIELTEHGRIVQARGFANRMPKNHEYTIINRWCSENNLVWDKHW